MSISRAIVRKILAIPSIGLGTGSTGKVYWLRAPNKAAAPYVILQRTDGDRWRAINNPSGISQITLQVTAYAPSYYAAEALQDKIELALDGFRGELPFDDAGVNKIKIAGISFQNELENIDETDDPLLYQKAASYLITYHQR